MDPKQQEAIENDPIIKKLSKSKTRELTAFLRSISSCLLDPDLLASQAFCLFLYSSCGAIAPYLPLYFKQFGLEPYQVGVILGLAPIIQALVSPIWAVIANKWHVQKLVFLTGVLSFVVKLLLILAVQPRKQFCLESYVNSTSNLTYIRSTSLADAMKNKEMTKWKEIALKPTVHKTPTQTVAPTTRSTVLNNSVVKNSGSNNNTIQLSDWNDEDIIEEPYKYRNGYGSYGLQPERDESKLAKKAHDSHKLSATIEKYDYRVAQRKRESRVISKKAQMFDRSLYETVQYVITVDKYELYDFFLIFMMFVIICDFLQAPTFALGDGSVLNRVEERYRMNPSKMRFTGSLGYVVAVLVVGAIVSKSVFTLCSISRLSYALAFYFSIGFVCMAFINALWFEYIYDKKTDKEIETWKNSLKTLFDLKGAAFFLGLMYISFCSGFLTPFINWYIDDLEGSTLLIATACATREFMILVFYIFGNSFVSILGRINVVIISLLSYTVCFFCYWLVQNLWVVVGVVAIEGAAFGLLWRSCEKFVNHLKVSSEVSSITKSFLNALFWGISNGGGTLIGGALYGWIGRRETFLTLGIVSIVMLLVVVTIQMCREKTDDEQEEVQQVKQSDDEVSEDED